MNPERLESLEGDPRPALLESELEALVCFARRDLMDEDFCPKQG
jgi:hypothetical protein